MIGLRRSTGINIDKLKRMFNEKYINHFLREISPKIKQERINSVMEIQSQISFELNQKKINQVYKCVIDRKEGINYIGRTEFDSPEIDNIVQIKGKVKKGEFVNVKIEKVNEFELIGKPLQNIQCDFS